MIDCTKKIISALETIGIPVYYEMILSSNCEVPCISYIELSNVATYNGDSLGYSRIQYQIKVWGTRITDLNKYALQIDEVLRPLDLKRVGCNELYDNNSTMIQKIMTYETFGFERF